MKLFITFSALFVSSLALGQNNPFWNPDANGDNLIGFTDLASLLSVYNSSVGLDSTVTCDFNGTDLEALALGAILGEIVIDSIYFESTLSGIAYDYAIGCPDPIETPWSVSESEIISIVDVANYVDLKYVYVTTQNSNWNCYFYLEAFSDPGAPWYFSSTIYSSYDSLPINSSHGFTFVAGENVPSQQPGIVFDSLGIRQASMDSNNYVRVVPYWHYAE